MTENEAKSLCGKIRQIAYDLHLFLGTGFLEKVYENGLVHRLEKAGMTVSTLLDVHVAQTINYLKAMRIEHGILINFGSEKFQCRKLVKRK